MFFPLVLYFLFLVFHLTLSKPGNPQENSSYVLYFPDLGCFFLKEKPPHSRYLCTLPLLEASLVAQKVKTLPAMQETWVRSLGREDPLE